MHDYAMVYVLRYQQAVARQAMRILSDVDTGPLTREVDALLFAASARDFRRAVRMLAGLDPATKTAMAKPLADFDAATPDLKKFRDVNEHFDAYLKGTGRQQKGHGVGLDELSSSYVRKGDNYLLTMRLGGRTKPLVLDVGATLAAVYALGAALP